MNDTSITIVGNVVDDPRLRLTKAGIPVTSFRIASTSRRYNREEGAWTDNQRLFATVTCWRGMAENVVSSVKKGQPIIATGRFYCREYVKDEVTRASYELDAEAVGHDLGRGTTTFLKVSRPYALTTVPLDEDGMPPIVAEEGIDFAAEEFESELVPA